MSANFRGAGAAAKTKKLDGLDDSAYEAAAEHPPMLKFAIGLCEVIVGVGANIIQVATSTYGYFSIAMGDHGKYLNFGELYKSSPFIFTMAFFIALAVQGFLHKNSQSMSSTWARLRHIQNFNIKSLHAKSATEAAMNIGGLYFIAALFANVVGDATFARLYTSNAFFIGCWIVFLTGGATLLFYDGATRIWGAWEDGKDYYAYHKQHSTKQS